MSIQRRRTPSEFQKAVLQAVADLGANAYGLQVWQLVTLRLGRELPMAQVYLALHRQAKRGFLTKTETRSPITRTRRVVLFALTDDGRAML